MRKSAVLTIAGIAIVLNACGKDTDTADLPEPLSAEEKITLVSTLPAPYSDADLAHGEALYNTQCKSCHTIEIGGKNLTGPNLYGVFGREAGAMADFNYSDAVLESGIVWSAEHVNEWLDNPRTYLRGTKMSFAGMREEQDRADVITWLMTETGYRSPEMLSGVATAPADEPAVPEEVVEETAEAEEATAE
jgi:cytochrome c